MKSVSSSPQKQQGIGLIEMMIAMAISLILLTGVVQIYSSSKQTYNMAENLSRMQESARFAMDMLVRDIRRAAYLPCQRPSNVVNTINNATGDTMLDYFSTGIQGFEGGVSSFPTADFPATGTTGGDRVAGADAVVLLGGSSESYTVSSHNASAANFKLNSLHTLQDGDIAMICDSNSAAIFQITNANSSNATIVHNTGTGTPGNCTKSLGGTGDCTNQAGITAYTYDDNAAMVKFQSTAYFIGVSTADTSTNSLYRRVLEPGGTFGNEELLEGIESMQLLYGVDTDADNMAERYVSADAVAGLGGWNNVISVRVGLLAHTPEEVHHEIDNKTYTVAGETIGTSSSVSHPADKRIRYVYTSTVKLRNRGI